MNASITEYHRQQLYLVATLRTPGQQGDADVLDEGGVAVGLLDDLVLKVGGAKLVLRPRKRFGSRSGFPRVRITSENILHDLKMN